MDPPSPSHNLTLPPYSLYHNLSPEEEGPVISLTSIIAIVVSLTLTIATVVVIFLFLRNRSQTADQNADNAGNPYDRRTLHDADIELGTPPNATENIVSASSSTYDEGVPEYDPSTLPKYREKPPTLSPAGS